MGYYLIIALFVGLDQWSKMWTRSHMALHESIPLIPDIFHLTYVHNYGAAFSILQNKQVFLILITACAIALILIYIFTERKHMSAWVLVSLSLVAGGGIGNLIDRIVNGYVVDMLDFRLWSPVFNVADIGVTCGCILLILSIFFADSPRKVRRKRLKEKSKPNEQKTHDRENH